MLQMKINLEERLRTLSSDLCTAIERGLRGALVAKEADLSRGLRPVLLTSHLGLDKSLSSRVVRSIGVDDPLRALQGIPTPQGLGLIADAVRRNGGADELVEALEAATASYANVLSEFSGGRTDLEATLVGWIPEQRERVERDARRSIFRGMTTLAGTRTSAIYNSVYLVPSQIEGRVDSLLVTVRQDLRRLRAGARLTLASIASLRQGLVRHELAGEVEVKDPRDLVIDELCSVPVPALELESHGNDMLVSVSRTALDVNEQCTVGLGWRTPGHFSIERDPSGEPQFLHMVARQPTEALVADLFVHKDVKLSGEPWAVITDGSRIQPTDWRRPTEDPSDNQQGGVQRTHLERLTDHPSGLNCEHVRSCPAIAENVCREAELDRAAFECYRGQIAFPAPSESLTLCWDSSPS